MRRLGGRFVIEAELGAGGMGSIYQGRDDESGAPVAIKILKRALLEDPVLRRRFRREAEALAKLRHPGIVEVLAFGEADGDLYTVLELVSGETLEAVMRHDGAMPSTRALPLVDRVLEALEVCHAEGIVHRDVKPSNVMVGFEAGEARVKLIDFGLARVKGPPLDRLTETGAVHGTPRYMAPEQCRGEDVGAPADVYAAGVVLYEMLAGSEPFHGSDAATFMAQHLFAEPPSLAQVAAHVSPGVAAAVHSALAKDPEARPTARALRDALGSALIGADPESAAETKARLRSDAATRSRGERAIGSSAAPVGAADMPAVAVAVWMAKGERSAALLGCLGTAGLRSALVPTEAPPERDAVLVVVSARDGLDRLRRLRELAPRLPVMVVDVDGPDQTTQAIRAGASDMLLRAASDAEIVPKLLRLLRRRGRR